MKSTKFHFRSNLRIVSTMSNEYLVFIKILQIKTKPNFLIIVIEICRNVTGGITLSKYLCDEL